MSDTEFGSMGEPVARTQVRVRMAARALGRNDLGHAFGHVSARLEPVSTGQQIQELDKRLRRIVRIHGLD